MKRVKIDTSRIRDWETFHDVFAEAFGFPGFYGRNMNAWIDCMSYLDDPDSGMTEVTCEEGEYVVLELEGVKGFRKRCREQYDALIECSAFVNWRRLEPGDNPVLMLSFYA
jgi:hypothetical protein